MATPEVVLSATMAHTPVEDQAELLHKTNTILEASRSRWGGLWGSGNEKDLCLAEADQYTAQANEIRAAIGLLGHNNHHQGQGQPGKPTVAPATSEIPCSEEEQQEAGQAPPADEEEEEAAPAPAMAPRWGPGRFLAAVKGFLLPRVLDGDLQAAYKSAERLDTLAECLRTQAELDIMFWQTSGGFVKPEELQLLYLARQIIICEGEKERFCEQHPGLDRHDEGLAGSGGLEDLSKRLMRYRALFEIRTGRWFSVYNEEWQVAADPHFPESKANPFHVQCFFDNSIREEDVANNTIGLRIQEVEKKRRFRLLPSSFRAGATAGVWGSSSTKAPSADANDKGFLSGLICQVASSLLLLRNMLAPSFFFGLAGQQTKALEEMDAESKEADVDSNV